ncbi:MAG TPA: hypothetical protein VMS93_00445 [Candidatus Saccharimonadales bacterium]|nr:hypothetical protein [Candidatus Saccharimonadales bacterium]
MRRSLAGVFLVGLGFLAWTTARADGVDLSFVMRVGGRTWLGFGAMVVSLMVANYLLNLLVIGIPAIKLGTVGRRGVLVGLVLLTILGQAADRLGAILALSAT